MTTLTSTAIEQPETSSFPLNDIPPPGSLQGKTVQELKLEIGDLKKKIGRENTMIAVAVLVCLAIGFGLMGAGIAVHCVPLALSSIFFIVLAIGIGIMTSTSHINHEVNTALEDTDHHHFLTENHIPLLSQTLIKSYHCFLKQKEFEKKISSYQPIQLEDQNFIEFLDKYKLSAGPTNTQQAKALFEEKQQIEKQIKELQLGQLAEGESSKLICYSRSLQF